MATSEATWEARVADVRADTTGERRQKLKSRGSGAGKKCTGVDTANSLSRCVTRLFGLMCGALVFPTTIALRSESCAGCFAFTGKKESSAAEDWTLRRPEPSYGRNCAAQGEQPGVSPRARLPLSEGAPRGSQARLLSPPPPPSELEKCLDECVERWGSPRPGETRADRDTRRMLLEHCVDECLESHHTDSAAPIFGLDSDADPSATLALPEEIDECGMPCTFWYDLVRALRTIFHALHTTFSRLFMMFHDFLLFSHFPFSEFSNFPYFQEFQLENTAEKVRKY